MLPAPLRCEPTLSTAPPLAHTWRRGRPAALIHPRDRRSARGTGRQRHRLPGPPRQVRDQPGGVKKHRAVKSKTTDSTRATTAAGLVSSDAYSAHVLALRQADLIPIWRNSAHQGRRAVSCPRMSPARPGAIRGSGGGDGSISVS